MTFPQNVRANKHIIAIIYERLLISFFLFPHPAIYLQYLPLLRALGVEGYNCPLSINNIARSVNLSSHSASYSFFRLAPKRVAKAL